MEATLRDLAALLDRFGERGWAGACRRLADASARAMTPAQRSEVARAAIELLHAPTGGLGDVVLYAGDRAADEDAEFRALRSRLYHEALADL